MAYWADELVASTREVIEKLQAFETLYGVGAVKSIASVCSGNREVEYYFEVVDYNGEHFTKIPISAVCMKDLR